MDDNKSCSRCRELKSVSEFHKRPDGRVYSYCKVCHREYMKQHYKSNKPVYLKKAAENRKLYKIQIYEWLFTYFKTHPCVDCGESDPVVLDFDHRDDVTKFKEVSAMVREYSLDAVKAEVAKCDVRCSNCHRRKTARQQNWYWLKVLDVALSAMESRSRYEREKV